MAFQGFNRVQTKRAVMMICLAAFAVWAVQLGGIAGLQAACPDDLHPDLNNVDDLRANLANAKALTGQLATTPTSSPLSNALAARTFAASLSAMQGLTARSIMNIYTFPPDYTCSMLYRYQWFNTFLTFFGLVLVAVAVALNVVHNARLALTSVLIYATVLSTANAQALITFEKYVPDKTLKSGKVFFIGCIGTAGLNMLMALVMGFNNDNNEVVEGRTNASSSETSSATDTPVKKEAEV